MNTEYKKEGTVKNIVKVLRLQKMVIMEENRKV